jgi:hypothetical protein
MNRNKEGRLMQLCYLYVNEGKCEMFIDDKMYFGHDEML